MVRYKPIYFLDMPCLAKTQSTDFFGVRVSRELVYILSLPICLDHIRFDLAYHGQLVEFIRGSNPESPNTWWPIDIFLEAEDDVVYKTRKTRVALICFRHEEGYWNVFNCSRALF